MIEALTSPGVLLTVGGALALLVGTYSLLSCLQAVQAIQAGRETQRLAREELQWRVKKQKLAFEVKKDQHEHSWNGYRKFEVQRIEHKENAAGTIKSFYLAPHDGKRLPVFEPGQFLTFRLKIPGEPGDVIRCYSLSDSHNPDLYRVSIKRVPNGRSSGFFHDRVSEGDILDVRAPAGKFVVDVIDRFPVVLVAGGVGVTPLLCMFNAIAAQQPTREVWFFYAAPAGGELIMREHLENLATACEHARVFFVYSKPDDADRAAIAASSAERGDRVVHCEGRVGGALFATVLPANVHETHHFYTCGPPPMMDAIEKDVAAMKAPKDQFHKEAFGSASVTPKQPAPETDAGAKAQPAQALQVSFGRSKKVAQWDPMAETLLAFAEAQGVTIDAGCCAGDCHTCKTAIKSGEVTHLRDLAEAPEAGTCLPCVAVPKSSLVLDA